MYVGGDVVRLSRTNDSETTSGGMDREWFPVYVEAITRLQPTVTTLLRSGEGSSIGEEKGIRRGRAEPKDL